MQSKRLARVSRMATEKNPNLPPKPWLNDTPPPPQFELPSSGLQMAKVGVALLEAKTGEAPPPSEAAMDTGEDGDAAKVEVVEEVPGVSVRPQAFKSLVGRGSSEFSSARQQVRGSFEIQGDCVFFNILLGYRLVVTNVWLEHSGVGFVVCLVILSTLFWFVLDVLGEQLEGALIRNNYGGHGRVIPPPSLHPTPDFTLLRQDAVEFSGSCCWCSLV